MRTQSITAPVEEPSSPEVLSQLVAENRALRLLVDRLAQYQQLAYRDALTGLYNRRCFDERLADECSRARRFGEPFAVALIDVDDLKIINDTAGHLAGDLVLAWLGQTLAALCREADTAFRIGGDEFAILLPSTDHIGARVAVHRMVARLAKAPGRPRLPEGLRTAVSFGTASAPVDSSDPQALLERADQAMYAHKRARKARRAGR